MVFVFKACKSNAFGKNNDGISKNNDGKPKINHGEAKIDIEYIQEE